MKFHTSKLTTQIDDPNNLIRRPSNDASDGNGFVKKAVDLQKLIRHLKTKHNLEVSSSEKDSRGRVRESIRDGAGSESSKKGNRLAVDQPAKDHFFVAALTK